jgi:hypothetical protein
MVKRIIQFGWMAVEFATILVVLCVLLHIVIGKDDSGYVSLVYAKTIDFLQKVPSGTVVGVFLILFLYWLVNGKYRQ